MVWRVLTSVAVRFVWLVVLFVTSFAAAQTLQSPSPRFESGNCPAAVATWGHTGKVDCGHLVVPEQRGRPQPGVMRLAVVILRATQASGKPPVVYLHGGPGLNAIPSRFPANAVRWQLAQDRDVVVYDQRGAGLSEPKPCPDVVEGSRFVDGADAARARACVTSMKAAGLEPLAFTTAENAADTIDLRRALGYRSWDIYGVSYGARLALEVMRRDRSGIRAVVLSNPVPPGPRFYAESPLSFQHTLERVFKACAADDACAAAFPAVERDFYALYDDLNAKPLEVVPQIATSAAPIRLDGERMVRELRNQLASARLIPRIPLLIHELLKGDRQKAARALVSPDVERLNPTLMLVSTHDICGRELQLAVEAVRHELAPPFVPSVDMYRACGAWQERFADASTYAPVRSDVPTLILTTEFDDRTPTAYGRLLSSTLKRSFVYELPGLVHAVEISSPCYESLLLSFLRDPTRDPDAACITATPRIAFETKSLDLRRFVIRISSADKQPAALMGTWEAVLPGPDATVHFDLRVEGSVLSGAISPDASTPNAQPVPIFEGRIDGTALTFKAISPDGARTIRFVATLGVDELHVVREVTVPPGAAPGREGVFGALGPNAFTAKRGN